MRGIMIEPLRAGVGKMAYTVCIERQEAYMRKYFSLSIALLALSLPLPRLGAQGARLAFRDDIDVQRAIAEYLMTGAIPVTNSFSYSGNELAEIIGYSGRVLGSAAFKSRFLFSITPAATGVNGIDIYVPSPGSDPTLLYFLDGLPLFTEIGAIFSKGDSVAGKVKVDLSVRPTFVGDNDISLFAPWDIDSMLRLLTSWKFPQEGWVSAGNGNAWIAAGRFKSGLGEGHFGNTFLNSRAEYYDQVQGAVGDKNFRFTSIIGSSSSHLYQAEAAIQFDPRVPGSDPTSINPWDPVNDHDFSTAMDAMKTFAYSQVEARFWDMFRFGIGQMTIVGGKTPSLTDILPTEFWHNGYTAGFSNVMLGLNASVAPYKGVLLFGEFTLDDLRGADEGPEGKPSQYAWQAGGRYSFKPAGELILTAGGEFSYVSEWAYCRWQPYLTLYQRHLINGSQGTDWPLGFTYGPDAKHLGLFVNASLPSGANAELGYEFLMKGPIYMGMMDADGDPIYYDYDSRTDNTKDTSLAAIEARPDQLSHGVSLKATWPFPWGFEAYGKLQYWNHTNFRNAAGDTRNAFLYSLGATWRY
jgi:hypothetical protein